VRATHYVDAAAVGIPPADWLALEDSTRRAIIHEHNARLDR
jgi:hypothetical protein